MEKYQHQLDSQVSSILDEVVSLRKELEQVKEESLIDALTGISNRKAFDAALERVFEEARAEQTPLSIMLADIDHFKKFNDTFGHLIGDKVLRFVGATLKRSVKGRDFAARFGGEEFVVILPQTELAGAGVLAEQIRKAISSGELKDRQSDESYGKITVSIGIAQLYPGNLPSDLLERADRALYAAKTQGRNRVEKFL
jgi:diguanylate cyclase